MSSNLFLSSMGGMSNCLLILSVPSNTCCIQNIIILLLFCFFVVFGRLGVVFFSCVFFSYCCSISVYRLIRLI
ncbi:hypothetical protein C1645_772838 [Glomus cerebriforme]|uniref:Uncharacterized protein n=1 Tax=Glomus cerebriforme TaxID=658196 RepID=A0A397ST22_9GLOM|nr:hypothetical protein C1645_772838 [Glomus cerebriforme]